MHRAYAIIVVVLLYVVSAVSVAAVFTDDWGDWEPTPTITPTPTESPSLTPTPSPSLTPTPAPPQDEESYLFFLLLFVGSLIVNLALIAIVIIITKKKPKPETKPIIRPIPKPVPKMHLLAEYVRKNQKKVQSAKMRSFLEEKGYPKSWVNNAFDEAQVNAAPTPAIVKLPKLVVPSPPEPVAEYQSNEPVQRIEKPKEDPIDALRKKTAFDKLRATLKPRENAKRDGTEN